MKISIITATYNSADTVEDTIKSIVGQTYPNVEYIIVDGGSTDGTLDIVNRYKDRITRVISEKDNGIFDAFNKGIALTTGDIVGILNSDDFYADSSVIQNVADKFKSSSVDTVYGDLVYIDPQDTSIVRRLWRAGEYQKSKFKTGWMPPHPTFFAKENHR